MGDENEKKVKSNERRIIRSKKAINEGIVRMRKPISLFPDESKE